MSKICRDRFGLYFIRNGSINRPAPGEYSAFDEGLVPECHHFEGTSTFGVGKLQKRGEYLETWYVYGRAYEWIRMTDAEQDYVVRYHNNDYGYINDMSFSERRNSHRIICDLYDDVHRRIVYMREE